MQSKGSTATPLPRPLSKYFTVAYAYFMEHTNILMCREHFKTFNSSLLIIATFEYKNKNIK